MTNCLSNQIQSKDKTGTGTFADGKIGNKIAGKHITGMETTKNGNAYYIQKIPVRGRYLKINSYLFPLPQLEITLNRKILQNPGW